MKQYDCPVVVYVNIRAVVCTEWETAFCSRDDSWEYLPNLSASDPAANAPAHPPIRYMDTVSDQRRLMIFSDGGKKCAEKDSLRKDLMCCGERMEKVINVGASSRMSRLADVSPWRVSLKLQCCIREWRSYLMRQRMLLLSEAVSDDPRKRKQYMSSQAVVKQNNYSAPFKIRNRVPLELKWPVSIVEFKCFKLLDECVKFVKHSRSYVTQNCVGKSPDMYIKVTTLRSANRFPRVAIEIF